MSFISAMAIVIPEEGGYVLSTLKGDSGGQTYAGISRTNWPDWSGWALIDAGDTTSLALKSQVSTFYQIHFWALLQGDALPERIGIIVFDFAVNAGIDAGVKALQRAVNGTGLARLGSALQRPPLAVDGDLGEETLNAVQSADQSTLVLRFFAKALAYYKSARGWETFHDGWIDRVIDELEMS